MKASSLPIWIMHVHLVNNNNNNNSNAIYRREMKLVPFNRRYCLLEVAALKFFLGDCLHGESISKFNIFNVNPLIWQRNRKVHRSNLLDTNFHNISDISLRVIFSLGKIRDFKRGVYWERFKLELFQLQ